VETLIEIQKQWQDTHVSMQVRSERLLDMSSDDIFKEMTARRALPGSLSWAFMGDNALK